MKYHYKATHYKANFLSSVCFILFILYSVLLYINHQYGIVALTYFIESDFAVSSTYHSSDWVSALLGTLLCSIPALILLRCLHFPLRLKGLAFLPSYIILGLITGISPTSVTSSEVNVNIVPAILLLLLSGILIFLSQIYHEDRGEHAPVPNYFAPNIFISCIGMLFCIMLTNSDRQLHLQLAMADGIHRNDISLLEELPSGETTSNNTITSIQVLHFSRQGVLADRLFTLPHLKGSTSLLPDTMPSSLVYHTPTLVYGHLQAVPVGNFNSATDFLGKALSRRLAILEGEGTTYADSLKARPLVDYYLCALLLDRKLKEFSSELPMYYDTNAILPQHYQEALALCRFMGIDTTPMTSDSAMDSTFADYNALQKEHSDFSTIQRKECTMSYPHTYWNYYFFGYNSNQR